MPEVTSYAPGTPNWVDLASHDIAGSVVFYGALFGWEGNDLGEETGHYTMFTLNGRLVGAVGPKSEGDPTPSNWNTYISVANVDDTAKAIEAAGGTILAPPFDVMTAGRMTVAMDPTGAAFCVWEARDTIGAEIVNEPGTLCWNELNSRDLDRAAAFYTEVFGYVITNEPNPMNYREFQLDGRAVAGSLPMPPQVPAEVPSHWLTYFAVADTDAAIAAATALGATVTLEPVDIPIGRFALLHDPQGAIFAVMAFTG